MLEVLQVSNSFAPNMLTVAVLENDRFAKEGIIAELEADGIAVIGTTGDPAMIQTIVAEQQPDAVIIDLKLSRDDNEFRGLAVIDAIKQASPATRCIVVTAFPSVANFRASVLAGAEGFIAKENSIQNGLTMGEAVRRAVRGERCYDGELVAQFVMLTKLQPDTAIRNPLSEREQEVLQLAQHSNEEIATKLTLAESTVKAHFKNSFEKLTGPAGRKIRNRYDAAEIARILGFLKT